MLIIFCIFLSLAGCVLHAFSLVASHSGAVAYLWLIATFVLGMVGWIGFFLILTAIISLFFDRKKQYFTTPEFVRAWFHIMVEFLLNIVNARVHVEGLEQLDADTGYLFVANHRSCYDSIASIYMLRKRRSIFISKPSNINIPLFGRYMHRMGYLAIDREDPRKAMKTIIEAADYMKQTKGDVVICPEGTRNKEFDPTRVRETGLLPFHNGVLKIAQMADAPVAVLYTSGAEQIRNQNLLKRTDIDLKIIAVYPSDYVKKAKTALLGDEIREKFYQAMEKN